MTHICHENTQHENINKVISYTVLYYMQKLAQTQIDCLQGGAEDEPYSYSILLVAAFGQCQQIPDIYPCTEHSHYDQMVDSMLS